MAARQFRHRPAPYYIDLRFLATLTERSRFTRDVKATLLLLIKRPSMSSHA
jgi:hypothetical protein